MPRSWLELRPFLDTDAEFFAALASDQRVVRFIGYGQPWSQLEIDSCVEAALHHENLEHIGASRWFVATEADHRVGVVFSTRQDSSVEIGYWVSPEHWGRGIGGSMLDRALAITAELFGVATFSAGVAAGNTVSAHLLTTRGFVLESSSDELEQYVLNLPAR
ncbi:GNAT family N-acetyltransferase [Glutamicibacter sp. JL.03c]|uniref:GNAT family N-acetyltransferase n=1 Tax=Glutamicibacter sp. JL.03c TaxID=2984842 RepID=UPI0021F6A1AB|nr:GNAT family N-acetyltransferase [Glutamicibacter sp. JL.03c]UYQ77415.1 GNAT family N-acetyltransferase [Glutamicibacter sp. JL.03c]